VMISEKPRRMVNSSGVTGASFRITYFAIESPSQEPSVI
jgi:hypothetical protein